MAIDLGRSETARVHCPEPGRVIQAKMHRVSPILLHQGNSKTVLSLENDEPAPKRQRDSSSSVASHASMPPKGATVLPPNPLALRAAHQQRPSLLPCFFPTPDMLYSPELFAHWSAALLQRPFMPTLPPLTSPLISFPKSSSSPSEQLSPDDGGASSSASPSQTPIKKESPPSSADSPASTGTKKGGFDVSDLLSKP